MKWLGIELQKLIRSTNDTNRFEASRDIVNDAIHTLDALPPIERGRVQDMLIASHQSQMIGDFRIPFDVRDEFDWIEGILATIED